MTSERVLFYADISNRFGVGHVMRSLNLASELVKLGYEVHFIKETDWPTWLELPTKIHFVNTASILEPSKYRVVCFDLYHSRKSYRKFYKYRKSFRLLITDSWAPYFGFNLVVNPNPKNIGNIWYLKNRHLNGLEYVISRSDTQELVSAPKYSDAEYDLMVIFGGTDPFRLTGYILTYLSKLKISFTAIVVSNIKHPNLSSKYGTLKIIPPTFHIPEIIQSTQVVITSSGTTIWDALALKKKVFVISTNLLQFYICKKLDKTGLIRHLGHKEYLYKTIAKELEEVLEYKNIVKPDIAYVDGKGAERIAAHLSRLLS